MNIFVYYDVFFFFFYDVYYYVTCIYEYVDVNVQNRCLRFGATTTQLKKSKNT